MLMLSVDFSKVTAAPKLFVGKRFLEQILMKFLFTAYVCTMRRPAIHQVGVAQCPVFSISKCLEPQPALLVSFWDMLLRIVVACVC